MVYNYSYLNNLLFSFHSEKKTFTNQENFVVIEMISQVFESSLTISTKAENFHGKIHN